MISLKNIYEPIVNDITTLGARLKKTIAKGSRRTTITCEVIARKNKRNFNKMYNALVSMSRMKKAFLCMAIYIIVFIIWQLFAYSLEQTTFVTINLILVGTVATLICIILYKAKQVYIMLNETIEEQNALKKKKDQEIATLKSEIMQLKLASKKQVSFGKKSQALLDAVEKYYQAKTNTEPQGQFILKALAECYEICGGIIYYKNNQNNKFEYAGEYALLTHPEIEPVGENDGFLGQTIKDGIPIEVKDVPADYFSVLSGLGQTSSIQLYVLPIKYNSEVVAIAEITSFSKLSIVDVWSDIDNLILSSIKN